jgi:hypothetical protein
MNLLSILNDDDSKKVTPSIAALVHHPTADAPSPSTDNPPQNGPPGNEANDDTTAPRKRQRIEDPPSPSSTTMPVAAKIPSLNQSQSGRSTPARSSRPGVSPQQVHKPLPASQTQASVSRNNSVSVVSDSIDVLEPSIVNMQPSEELTRFISDFIFLNLNESEYENLEVFKSRFVTYL